VNTHKPLDLNAVEPPISFLVENLRFVSKFPQGTDQSLWTATVIACRRGAQIAVSEEVLFVEFDGMAFIHGIQYEDGYPKGINQDRAIKQQAFINFLRGETCNSNDALGSISSVLIGHEYATEGKATAAYVLARATPLIIGVGYFNDDGKFELVGVE
jgi:hypothetical protein